ncbi:MAG: hypothetical protein R2874_14545 [Desulfobacterales bacterium]
MDCCRRHGRARGGEKASALAVDFIAGEIKAETETSLAKAHHAIKQAARRKARGPEGMGTTVVALRMDAGQYEIRVGGDCRAYLWDGAISNSSPKITPMFSTWTPALSLPASLPDIPIRMFSCRPLAQRTWPT